MKSLLVGDPHLGANLSYGKNIPGLMLNSKVLDQTDLLDFIYEEAVASSVTDILLSGDVFEDPNPNYILIKLFISWVKKCVHNGIKVHILLGNHDLLRNGRFVDSPLDILFESEIDNVFVYKEFHTIFIGRTGFTLMPFKDRKSLEHTSNADAINTINNLLMYELSTIPSTYNKVVLGHFALEGSIFVGNEIDDSSNELFCPLNMFKGYDAVWMGHVHKYQVLSKSPHIAHLGSLDISNFGETDQKKYIILYDCLSGDWEKKLLPTRSLKKITIDIPKKQLDTTSFVLNHLKTLNDLARSIVKIEVNISDPEAKSLDKSKIEEFLLNEKVFNIIQIAEAKQIQILKKEVQSKIDTKIDVKSAVKEYASLYIEKEKVSKFIELALKVHEESST